jgi:hypothetical protein
MQHFVQSLIFVTNSHTCRELPHDLSRFPAIVFHAESASVCSKIRDVAQYVPDQFENMYFSADGNNSIEIVFARNRSVVHTSGTVIEFVQGYAHPLLGDVNFAALLGIAIPKAFLVTDDEVDRFRDFFSAFQESAFIGKVALAQFNERFPHRKLTEADLPAIVLERPQLPLVTLRNVRPQSVGQFATVKKLLSERSGGVRRRRGGGKPFKTAIPLQFHTERFWFTLTLAIVTITGTVGFIFVRARACIHHTDRTPASVFPVV